MVTTVVMSCRHTASHIHPPGPPHDIVVMAVGGGVTIPRLISLILIRRQHGTIVGGGIVVK